MKKQQNKFLNLENTERTLYIRILIWAYNKQEKGFSWEELRTAFKLDHNQEQWVQKVFRSNMSPSENLIDHLNYNSNENSHLFVISAKGTSAAIDYLNLKEAEKSSKRAEKIAVIAITIGIIVGLAQILVTICY